MHSSSRRRWWPIVAAWAVVLLVVNDAAWAQFASNLRLSSPNGRTVLEIRKGTQPANPRLLFTAVITAGPVGGTTSLLLQQALLPDIFNPGAPAAGWVTVLSSITAFSLGGGCGRSNLIDFPFINNNRPVILRITGTTQQVITLGIAGNDLYDSIDCVMQRDGRVLYMLTNRTQSRLELRREQGGLLQLVRDDFGTVITPFVGGMRPSIARVRRSFTSTATAVVPGAAAPKSSHDDDLILFFLGRLAPFSVAKLYGFRDNDSLTLVSQCDGPTSPAPTAFTIPKESAVAGGVAVGPSRNDNVLWGDYFSLGAGGCTQLQPPESFGSTGPFSLYTWTGVVASQLPLDNPPFWALNFTLLMTPGVVTTFDSGTRRTYVNPFANRGGPRTGCALTGSEIDVVELAIGPGKNNTQVQHSLIVADVQDTISGSSVEDVWESLSRCD